MSFGIGSNPNKPSVQSPGEQELNQESIPPLQSQKSYEGVTTYEAIKSELKAQGFQLDQCKISDLKGKFGNEEGFVVASSAKIGNEHFFKFDVNWTAKVKTPPEAQEKTVTFKQAIYTNVQVPEGGSAKELESAKQKAYQIAKSYELTQRNLTKLSDSPARSVGAAQFEVLKNENSVLFSSDKKVSKQNFTAMSFETKTPLPIDYTSKKVKDVAQSEITKMNSMSSKQVALTGDSKFARFENAEKNAASELHLDPEFQKFIREKVEIYQENFDHLFKVAEGKIASATKIMGTDEFKEKQAELTASGTLNDPAVGTGRPINQNDVLRKELIEKSGILSLEKTIGKLNILEQNYRAAADIILKSCSDEIAEGLYDGGAKIDQGMRDLDSKYEELATKAISPKNIEDSSLAEMPSSLEAMYKSIGNLLNIEQNLGLFDSSDIPLFEDKIKGAKELIQNVNSDKSNLSETDLKRINAAEKYVTEFEGKVNALKSSNGDLETELLKLMDENIENLRAMEKNFNPDDTDLIDAQIGILKNQIRDLKEINDKEQNVAPHNLIKSAEKYVNKVEKRIGVGKLTEVVNEEYDDEEYDDLDALLEVALSDDGAIDDEYHNDLRELQDLQIDLLSYLSEVEMSFELHLINDDDHEHSIAKLKEKVETAFEQMKDLTERQIAFTNKHKSEKAATAFSIEEREFYNDKESFRLFSRKVHEEIKNLDKKIELLEKDGVVSPITESKPKISVSGAEVDKFFEVQPEQIKQMLKAREELDKEITKFEEGENLTDSTINELNAKLDSLETQILELVEDHDKILNDFPDMEIRKKQRINLFLKTIDEDSLSIGFAERIKALSSGL